MKSASEIKKELEDGAECSCCDGGCKTCADALALIQQLESDKQQLEGMLTHMCQLCDAAAGRALTMEERVHQLEAELKATKDEFDEYARQY